MVPLYTKREAVSSCKLVNASQDMYTSLVSWFVVVLALNHSKVSSSASYQEDIVTGEVAVYDVIGMKVGKGRSDIVAEVYLTW